MVFASIVISGALRDLVTKGTNLLAGLASPKLREGTAGRDTRYSTNYFNSNAAALKLTHSVRKDFTGLAMAALIAWKLTVIIAISVAVAAATIKTHQLIVIL